jgi:hypothetical protein
MPGYVAPCPGNRTPPHPAGWLPTLLRRDFGLRSCSTAPERSSATTAMR